MVWRYRNKDDAATVSLEGSPATCSSTGDTDTSADSSATICSDTTSTADIDDSATFKVSCDTIDKADLSYATNRLLVLMLLVFLLALMYVFQAVVLSSISRYSDPQTPT